MRVNGRLQRGAAVARLLRGAWRPTPPGTVCAGDLRLATPLLLQLGAAPLVWWQIRHGPLAGSHAAQRLRSAYRLQALSAARAAGRLQILAQLLRRAGVPALLLKGHAMARHYPQACLRPYGDIDIWVAAAHLQKVQALVLGAPEPLYVDLHSGFDGFAPDAFVALWQRSVEVLPQAPCLRGLGQEDHLRLLAMHLLRHGASRPAWLCDIALLLETLPANFDWPLCLGANRLQSGWLQTVLGLCVQLLGAEADRAPQVLHSAPAWLTHAVLNTWGSGHGEPLWVLDRSAWRLWRQPVALYRDVAHRWPNAMQAAVHLGAPLHGAAPVLAKPRVFVRRGRHWLGRALAWRGASAVE